MQEITNADYFMLALCMWREARGEGISGMIAVGCVARNRVNKHSSSFYIEIVKPLQFSSITDKGDSQLGLYPNIHDAAMLEAIQLAEAIIHNRVTDPTLEATLYYDDSITFPKSWNPSRVMATIKIGRFNFYKEV